MPTVLSKDRINLVVAPEVSSLSETGAVSTAGFNIPALQTRKAEDERLRHPIIEPVAYEPNHADQTPEEPEGADPYRGGHRADPEAIWNVNTQEWHAFLERELVTA